MVIAEVTRTQLPMGIAICLLIWLIWALRSWGKAPRKLPAHSFRQDLAVFMASALISIIAFDLVLYERGTWEALMIHVIPAALISLTFASINTLRRKRYLRLRRTDSPSS
jgi:hypothetical protein